MGVQCQGYHLKGANWKAGKATEAELGAADDKHAERAAYATMSGLSTSFLFDQNDFPCEKCVSFFLRESIGGKSFVFKCTGNTGGYAVDSGFVDATDITRKFKKDLSGVVYFASGNVYIAGRRVTVKTVKVPGAVDKMTASGRDDITAPAIPATFTAMPLYPNF